LYKDFYINLRSKPGKFSTSSLEARHLYHIIKLIKQVQHYSYIIMATYILTSTSHSITSSGWS